MGPSLRRSSAREITTPTSRSGPQRRARRPPRRRARLRRGIHPDGRERLIEVKTTPLRRTPFYLTANELRASQARADATRFTASTTGAARRASSSSRRPWTSASTFTLFSTAPASGGYRRMRSKVGPHQRLVPGVLDDSEATFHAFPRCTGVRASETGHGGQTVGPAA